jgi:prolyl-tRNA synthetase
MKATQLLFDNTLGQSKNQSQVIALLEKANLIHQEASGIYSYLTLGKKLIKKIENLIIQKMNDIGFNEVEFSLIQNAQLWMDSNRYETYGAELFKLNDEHNKNHFILSATHEELVTSLMKDYYNQRANIQANVFQIGKKFRNELRCKAGLVRTREFLMKDAYSFYSNYNELKTKYLEVKNAYHEIFKALNIDIICASSDNGQMGGNNSEEFHYITQMGEAKIFLNDNHDYISEDKIKEEDKENYKQFTSLELGHIFDLGQFYSQIFNFKDSNREYVNMACYGIGISRVIMAFIESHMDQFGFWGNETINTFDLSLVLLNQEQEEVNNFAHNVYNILKNKKIDLLFDDRDKRAGQKLNYSEMIGVNKRIIISEQSMINNQFELLDRKTMTKQFLTKDELINYFN